MSESGADYLCLAGPTASGKSAAALAIAAALAPRHAVEIVSVDSALVYRGMDIGTAKPTTAERAAVPHHLIDIVDPAERYSAARFVADAAAAIAAIRSRGAIPLLVGGTMLYFKALREGLDEMPASDLAIRADIEREAAAEGWAAMHHRLAEVDPRSAARLAPLDAQRVSRALEVWRSSGQTLSSLQRGGASRASDSRACGARDFVSIALEPSDRAELHRHIATRFDAMLTAGLIDEVSRLHARDDLDPRMPSMRCVGYRQVWDFLEGRIDRSTMRERAIAATRQLAKRQITWLRATPDRIVVDSLARDAIEQVVMKAIALIRDRYD